MHAPSCSHNPKSQLKKQWPTQAPQVSTPPEENPTTFKDFSAVVSCVKELGLAVFWKDKQLLFQLEQPKQLETRGQTKCCTISSLCCPNNGTNLYIF